MMTDPILERRLRWYQAATLFAGSPRTGWVIVGLVVDLSSACSAEVGNRALTLKAL